MAFEPNTTKFNDNTKLDIQSGTVEVETSNKTASGVNSQTKDDGTEDYISKKEIVELGKPISVKTLDDWKSDNNEQFEIKITDKTYQHPSTPVYENVVTDKNPVTTTIKDDTDITPNNPNDNKIETNQEQVILKIVACDSTGNPIMDGNKYTFVNEVNEGSNAKYMVLAFDPKATEFTTTTVLNSALQGGTVTIKTVDGTAITTGTKDNAELDYVSETSKIVTVGEVFEIKTLDDYLSDDGEKYKVSINDKTYEHPASGTIYENVVTNTDPVTTTIKDNTTPNTETDVESVKIVLVAVDSLTTKISDITGADGKLIIDNTNGTAEGGKLYYIAVAVDKDGKPLGNQDGDVTINYGTTPTASGKDATAGVDYDNTTTKTTKVGEVFEVKTNDDYYAEGDENFTVKITDLVNSPYETSSIDIDNDKVTSTIKDNAPTINGTVVSGGEDTNSNTYGSEDTVYAIITGETTVNEGGEVVYTVKLVDKDGNTVIPTKETTVTVKYTNNGTTSTDDTNKVNNETITVKIPANGSEGKFTVKTKDDYYAEEDESYSLKITDINKTGEFENIKFDSYPNTIPNNPSNNVTTTIKDNPADINKPDDNTGTDNPTDGKYGEEDTVYVKIVDNAEVVEGGNLVHNIQLIDKDGKSVIIPDGEEITVTLKYTTNHDIKDSDFVNGSNQYNETTKTITVTIDKNTPKDENGIYKLPITNKTIDDFTSEGNEVYILTITNVVQKDGKFENIAIGNPNGGEKSVTGTIKDGVTLGDPVDATVYEDGLNNSSDNTENSSNNSLGITNPNNDTYTIQFETGLTTDKQSNGQNITYVYSENNTKITATTGTGANKKDIFTIKINQDGTYDFKLLQAMDHEYGNNGKNDFDLPFNFNVTSNGMTSDNKTFNVTVVDSVPNAKDKTVTTKEDTATTIRLSNDAFKDKGTIKINGIDVAKGAEISIYEPSDTNKEHPIGKLLNNGNGTVKFTPSPDYSNYDFTKSPQFSYTVTDFDGDEATATVTVNVKPVADAPTIFVKNVETKEDAENIQEGTNKVALELKVPSLSKDSDATSQTSPTGYTAKQNSNTTVSTPTLNGLGDKNGTVTGDKPERNGEITLTFTNGDKLKNLDGTVGAKIFKVDGTTQVGTDITKVNQTLKVIIVNDTKHLS